jgi:hypothetical protein
VILWLSGSRTTMSSSLAMKKSGALFRVRYRALTFSSTAISTARVVDVVAGRTTWVNPGNIARVSRSDADRSRRPSILRIDVRKDGWEKQTVEVPFQPYEDVFHEDIVSSDIPVDESMFVRGLAALESLKTHGGAGLKAFLENNLDQFGPDVATEIRALAEEVYRDGTI